MVEISDIVVKPFDTFFCFDRIDGQTDCYSCQLNLLPCVCIQQILLSTGFDKSLETPDSTKPGKRLRHISQPR